MIEIVTERLVLRPLELDDAAGIRRLPERRDPEDRLVPVLGRRRTRWPTPSASSALPQARASSSSTPGASGAAGRDRPGQRSAVGRLCGARRRRPASRQRRSASRWRRDRQRLPAWPEEAIGKMIATLFEQHDLHRVYAEADDRDRRGPPAARRLGLSPRGTPGRRRLVQGRIVDAAHLRRAATRMAGLVVGPRSLGPRQTARARASPPTSTREVSLGFVYRYTNHMVARVTLQSITEHVVGVRKMTISNACSRPRAPCPPAARAGLRGRRGLGYAGPDASTRTLARRSTGLVGVRLTNTPDEAFFDDLVARASASWAQIARALTPRARCSSALPLRPRAGQPRARPPTSPWTAEFVSSCLSDDGASDPVAHGRLMPMVFVDQHPSGPGSAR